MAEYFCTLSLISNCHRLHFLLPKLVFNTFSSHKSNGTAHFKKCKQLFEYKHLLLLRDIWWLKLLSIFNTSVNWTPVAALDSCFPASVSNTHCYILMKPWTLSTDFYFLHRNVKMTRRTNISYFAFFSSPRQFRELFEDFITRHDTQHNDTQYNDNQHYGIQHSNKKMWHSALQHTAKWHLILMPSVIMLSVSIKCIILNIVMLNVVAQG